MAGFLERPTSGLYPEILLYSALALQAVIYVGAAVVLAGGDWRVCILWSLHPFFWEEVNISHEPSAPLFPLDQLCSCRDLRQHG